MPSTGRMGFPASPHEGPARWEVEAKPAMRKTSCYLKEWPPSHDFWWEMGDSETESTIRTCL